MGYLVIHDCKQRHDHQDSRVFSDLCCPDEDQALPLAGCGFDNEVVALEKSVKTGRLPVAWTYFSGLMNLEKEIRCGLVKRVRIKTYAALFINRDKSFVRCKFWPPVLVSDKLVGFIEGTGSVI